MKMPLVSLDRHRHLGLLLLRLGLGAAFLAHGTTKLLGGPPVWEQVGSVMSLVGLTEGHAAWGLVAAVTELVGGLLIALGLLFRFACLGLIALLCFALAHHANAGDPFAVWSHPASLLAVFVGLFFVGPGRYSLDVGFTDADTLARSRPPAEKQRRREAPAPQPA